LKELVVSHVWLLQPLGVRRRDDSFNRNCAPFRDD
jgi:hypothetical protein